MDNAPQCWAWAWTLNAALWTVIVWCVSALLYPWL